MYSLHIAVAVLYISLSICFITGINWFDLQSRPKAVVCVGEIHEHSIQLYPTDVPHVTHSLAGWTSGWPCNLRYCQHRAVQDTQIQLLDSFVSEYYNSGVSPVGLGRAGAIWNMLLCLWSSLVQWFTESNSCAAETLFGCIEDDLWNFLLGTVLERRCCDRGKSSQLQNLLLLQRE